MSGCTLQMAALTGLIFLDPQSTWAGGGEGSNPGAIVEANFNEFCN